VEPESSLWYSQEPATGRSLQPEESGPKRPTPLVKD